MTADTAGVAAFLDEWFEGTAAACVWGEPSCPPLWPEEEEAILRARPQRRDEFARGRAAARHALERVGAVAGPIPVGPRREPVWPAGFTGSITHCTGLVAAVAAATGTGTGTERRLVSLGIDAEPARGLPPDVRDTILLPSERHTDPIVETLLFSAKESIYKALFPVVGQWIDFLEVEVTLSPDGTFSARPAPSATPPTEVERLEGRFARAGGYVLTAATLY